MSRTLRMLLLTGLCTLPLRAWGEEASATKPPVVVELFTSQGCSSCPPAEALLGKLAKRPGVVALALHVDYWDYIGWKDPYASPAFTQRQHAYAAALGLHMVYTPQMVVDGHIDVVGSHPLEVEAAMADAAERDKLPVTIARDPGGAYRVRIAADAAGSRGGPATVWLVLFDREHQTAVMRGENAGATLTNHNVVREFRRLGEWSGQAMDLPLDLDPAQMKDGDCAVIVQAEPVGPVLGVAALHMDDAM